MLSVGIVTIMLGLSGPAAAFAADSPVIAITKVSSQPLPLAFGGGDVVYAYIVTNPGTIALSNVSVTDNSCNPVFGPEGDVNRNNMLDTNETWFFACRANVLTTTSGTATATGSSSGLTVQTITTNTVVVSTPSFPSTGFAPETN